MIETLVHAPALGLRLWDPWTRREVAAGPDVALVVENRPGRVHTLVRSPSGGHVLHEGPRVGAGPVPAHLEVTDKTSQILSMRTDLSLPHSAPVSLDPLGVPGAPDGTTPVFAHPSRNAPTGWVCLRACLRRQSTGKPVPWSIMEIRLGTDLVAIGLSGPDGAVVAALPPPPPRKRPMGLPDATPFETAAWTFSVRFRWDAARLSDDVPDLDDLAAQSLVEADTDLVGALGSVLARPGDNILSSGIRPAWGETPTDDRSSFLFLKA